MSAWEDEAPTEVDDELRQPHDGGAEAAVLSTVLLAPERLREVETLLREEHFFSEANRRIYEAALKLRDEGKPIDAVTVASKLKELGRLTQVGGTPYLHEVMDASPAVRNVRAHAITIHDRWRQRQLILAGQRIAALGYQPVADVQAYADESSRLVAQVARQSPKAPLERAGDVLQRLVVTMRGAALSSDQQRTPGIPSGVRCLDERTLGFELGRKWTVVARSGRGKTIFAMQCAVNTARRGMGVLVFSEQTREELLVLMLSHAARVDSRRIRLAQARATLTAEEWMRINAVLPEVERLPIFVDDRRDLDAAGIAEAARRAAEQSMAVDGVPIAQVVVDYVQRLKAPSYLPKNHREDQRIRENSKVLRDRVCVELNMSVIELAQMRVSTEDDGKKRTPKPAAGMVQGCSGVEQESDGVLYIWRPDPQDPSAATLVCTKARGNEEGFDVPVVFRGAYSTFEDPDMPGTQAGFFDEFAP